MNSNSKNYNEIILDLNNRIKEHIDIPTEKSQNQNKNIKVSNNVFTYLRRYIYFIVIPVVSIIILLIMKPSFFYKKHKDKENNVTKKLDYIKLILTGLISGLLISTAVYFYINRK